jgi:1,4-alpha-glucan branching enzyme
LVEYAIEFRYNGDAFQRVIYTESHDEAAASNGKRRLVDAIAPGDAGGWAAKKRSTLGASLVFTAPGIPMILQGQRSMSGSPLATATAWTGGRWTGSAAYTPSIGT